MRLRRGADPDLIILHPDGFHTAVAMSCTDYAGPSPFTKHELSAPPLLDVAGLSQMAHLIDELCQSDRFPNTEAPPKVGEVSYD